MNNRDIAATVLQTLAERGIPADVQELLVYGDPSRNIAPGALSKAVWAAINAERQRSRTRLSRFLFG